MAKVIGSFFNQKMSGALGDIVFDRRGYAYLKTGHRDAKTSKQGSYRQAMIVAQRGSNPAARPPGSCLKRPAPPVPGTHPHTGLSDYHGGLDLD